MKFTVLLFSFCSCMFWQSAMSQSDKQLAFNAGPELSLPVGDFSNGYSFGLGGSAQLEVPIQEHLKGTATAGIVFYNGKSIGGGLKNTGINIIPIRIGAKYELLGGIYGAFQVGVGLFNKGIGTAFSYSPQVGYEFRSKSGRSLDASFKYDGYSKNGTLAALGFRVAVVL